MCKVSIMIAAYNIEDYIERCMKSCVNQTFKDIEIIVVNDGSTDKTLEKIKQFQDDRIVLIDKKNEGLLEARKSALKVAKGEYLYFVDGDDYIREDAVELLYVKALKNNIDIVCNDFLIVNQYGEETTGWQHFEKVDFSKKFIDLLFNNSIVHNIWGKLIKREFIINNILEFPEGFSFGEDLAFIYSLAIHNPKFSILEEKLYFYYRRKGSLDNGINKKTYEISKAIEFLSRQLKKFSLYETYREEFEYLAYQHCYYKRKNYIFNNNNEISRKIFDGWKKLNIKINTKNNRFYKKLYENDSKKAVFWDSLFQRSYFIGRIYYKYKKIM